MPAASSVVNHALRFFLDGNPRRIPSGPYKHIPVPVFLCETAAETEPVPSRIRDIRKMLPQLYGIRILLLSQTASSYIAITPSIPIVDPHGMILQIMQHKQKHGRK